MTNQLQSDMRPFFMDLWTEHHFRADIVARVAGVSEATVLAMLRYQAVEATEAAKILSILSHLYQRRYTLETVQVKLVEEEYSSRKRK